MIVRNLINWLNTQIYIKVQINWLSTIPRLTYLFHQPCFPSFSCCFLVLVWYHSESRKHFNPKFEKCLLLVFSSCYINICFGFEGALFMLHLSLSCTIKVYC
ncbi:hypothetical protein VIGAN_03143700 [Vigna angularis var. angularis]|uniref:Uncharacterized protein n=1 Tax=Vigna angularis var. angularis TaxID=157739 RepID=A0A0S3RM26_PHAAN|nr:hypothetical protein VIGAN_03143700 [Vigna angularis var. angularis]